MSRRLATPVALAVIVVGIILSSIAVHGRWIAREGEAFDHGALGLSVRTPDPPIGIIDTVAGGAVGDGGPATEATLYAPSGVAFDQDGNMYIADSQGNRVRKVDPTGSISTVAGNDARAYAGDGRADAVSLDCPMGVAAGPDGSVYVAEYGCHRIRRIDGHGVITTVAGNGQWAHSGDGGPAVEAALQYPAGVAVGPDGSLYIADRQNNVVRKVDPAGIITTVAGGFVHTLRSRALRGGTVGSLIRLPEGLGDGGPAGRSLIAQPHAVALGSDGSLYIADTGNNRIRKIDLAGNNSTVAGGGKPREGLGDGGPAIEARLDHPRGVAVGPDGSIYVADTYSNRVRKIDPAGIITTVAGSGDTGSGGGGFAGDGGPATQALLRYPEGVAMDANGELHIADTLNHRVRKVDKAGIITTVAGGALGAGGPASEAPIYKQLGIAVGPDGSLYFSEWDDNRVRRIDPKGIITTVAGNGLPGHSGDGGPAIDACLIHPKGVAVGSDGSLYIADYGNDRVRKVNPAGIITTVAGNGRGNWSGDGGPATQATLFRPADVAVDTDGCLYVADRENHRVRKVDAAGVISTVAGNGKPGYSGDGAPATAAALHRPCAVALGPDGSLYIADGRNFRIRRVDAAGVISTVAGNGKPGYSGDGGLAMEASLNWYEAHSLAVGPDGALYIPDQCNHRVRRVAPSNVTNMHNLNLGDIDVFGGYLVVHLPIIQTIAGNGERNPWGDGGRATEAGLCYPNGVAVAKDGTLYIADGGNRRIRRIRWLPQGPEAAKALADELSAKAGDSASAWREVAELYIIAQAWDKAVTAGERWLALMPQDDEAGRVRAELLVARACVAKRDDHAARRRLIRVLARSRDPSLLRQAAEMLVDLYLMREERAQAIATLTDLRMRTQDRSLLDWIDGRLKGLAGEEPILPDALR